MNDLAVFDFHGAEVRVVTIDGEPHWVAKDVCDVLGYADAVNNVRHILQRLDDDEKVQTSISSTMNPVANFNKPVWCVSEAGLYSLILWAQIPAAKEFKRWVTHEVLPQIRKTGTFGLPQTFAEALRLAADQAQLLEEKERALLEAEPKVKFHDQVTGSSDTVDMKDAAKILNMGMGRTKLFEFLREQGILMRNNTPYQTFIDRGYFRVVEVSYQTPDGETHVRTKTVVYQKGLAYIRKAIEEFNA